MDTPAGSTTLLRCLVIVAALVWSAASSAAVRHADDDPDSLAASEDSFVRHLSKGWFPQPYSLTQIGFASVVNIHRWDAVTALRSGSFAPTRNPFTTTDPFIDEERRIKKKFSNEDATGDGFSEGYGSDGLVWAKAVPVLSAVARAHASYDRLRTALYAVDNSKSFLADDGTLRSMKEVSVLHVEQERCAIGASVLVPVYGIYVDTELAEISSLYFVSAGVNASLLLRGRFTQFTQIARPKDMIRMANGTDTVTVRKDAIVESMQPVVGSVVLSCGWMLGLRGSTFVSVEPFVALPLTSVLTDVPWHQYLLGVRFALGVERD
ncbi:MAG: hypothetical protein ACKOAG_11640 [Candidatus Kapaibacterium sp.]